MGGERREPGEGLVGREKRAERVRRGYWDCRRESLEREKGLVVHDLL
jgi:hypothetical protein